MRRFPSWRGKDKCNDRNAWRSLKKARRRNHFGGHFSLATNSSFELGSRIVIEAKMEAYGRHSLHHDSVYDPTSLESRLLDRDSGARAPRLNFSPCFSLPFQFVEGRVSQGSSGI